MATESTADLRSSSFDLVSFRHELHRHPEVGLDLPRTQGAVLDALAPLDLEVTSGRSSSSIVAVLRGGAVASSDPAQRPTVLLRGDMDALPVDEQVDVPFRSTVPGAMHACGHDLHTTMLVGAAHRLAARAASLPGDVVFMFQPGEEGWDGAQHMLDEGVLEASGRRPDAAFALHVISGLIPCGAVVTRPGPVMAASDRLRVVVHGRGGHASTPHLSLDPIPAACAMVLALPGELTRSIDSFAPRVVTVGRFQAGTRSNIIPPSAEFEATIRTFDRAVRDQVAVVIERVCRGIAAAHGVEVDVELVTEYPLTVNDAAAVDLGLRTAGELFGTAATLRLPQPVTGSEDFSKVINEVPGAMLFLGATPADADPLTAPSNHSPLAQFDDRVLGAGADLYAALATAQLTHG